MPIKTLWGFVIILLAMFVPAIQAQDTTCLPSRLSIGEQGQVTPGDPNRMRSEPSVNAPVVGEIPASTVFDVVGISACAEGFLWREVSYNGVIGWTAEANADTYFLDPVIPPPDLTDVSWNADGTQLAVASEDGLYIFNATDYTATPRYLLDETHVIALDFHPLDPQLIALQLNYFADYDVYVAVLYDLMTETEQAELIPMRGIPAGGYNVGINFSADGSRTVAGTPWTLGVADVSAGELLYDLILPELPEPMQAPPDGNVPVNPVISPDGRLVAFHNGLIQFVDLETETYTVIGEQMDRIADIEFSPDSSQILVAYASGQIQVLDVTTLEQNLNFIVADGVQGISDVAYHPDGNVIAIAGGEMVHMYDANTVEMLASYAINADSVTSLAFSKDGSLLAVLVGQTVKILETETYTEIATLTVP